MQSIAPELSPTTLSTEQHSIAQVFFYHVLVCGTMTHHRRFSSGRDFEETDRIEIRRHLRPTLTHPPALLSLAVDV
jgi:hypothetical protein